LLHSRKRKKPCRAHLKKPISLALRANWPKHAPVTALRRS
jgi:hypothetical protein